METALIIPIANAEAVVSSWRRRFDPSAAMGVPAHVTLIYPFRSWERFDVAAEAALTNALKVVPPFTLTFGEVRRFQSTLWLAPEPAEPVVRLIEALVLGFPDCPPYGGAHAGITPHLTIADFPETQSQEGELDRIERAFMAEASPLLPIRTRVETAALLGKDDGTWHELRRYPIGTPPAAVG